MNPDTLETIIQALYLGILVAAIGTCIHIALRGEGETK